MGVKILNNSRTVSLMTTCETVVEGLFGVLWDVPALVLSVTDGRPATDEYAVLNARNENV